MVFISHKAGIDVRPQDRVALGEDKGLAVRVVASFIVPAGDRDGIYDRSGKAVTIVVINIVIPVM